MKRLLTLACLLFSVQVLAAQSYFIENVTTSDANPALAASTKSLLESSVTAAGGQVAPSENGADFILRSSLVKLGAAYVLTVTKVGKGNQSYTSHQKAATVEELDDAADRAVRAAMLGTTAKQDLRVGEVKEREENQLTNRIKSRSVTYLGFGPADFQNMGNSQLSYNLAIGHYWEVNPHAAIKLVGNGAIGGDWKTYMVDLQLGLNYYFTDEDAAPFIGAGVGFGLSGSPNATSVGGFAGNIGLGYEFFRTSSTQLEISLGYSTIFANNTVGTPGYLFAKIGILF